jgi:hypothetical protein
MARSRIEARSAEMGAFRLQALRFRRCVRRINMPKFFSRNIGRRGRIFRAVCGAVMILAGLILCHISRWACAALVIAGAFVLYEAKRGWCLARACGMKTRL